MSRSPGRTYRTGAVGALLDEFERATEELARLVEGLTDADFEAVRDPATEEEDCRSIQTVVHHVARAGHAHANHLRVAFGLEWSRVGLPLGSRAESLRQLGAMRAYVAATLDGRWEMPDEELTAVQFQAAWGPRYDVEQMLEHAIVHVLRHRRQIERFLAGLPGAGENDTLTLRPAEPAEAEMLTALARRSKASWGYSPEFLQACEQELSYTAAEIRSERFRFVVGEGLGACVGFYALLRTSQDEMELEALFVEPESMGRGYGRSLMEHAKATAAAWGASRLTIQGDPNAARFYEAAGGVLAGERESASIPGRFLPLYVVDLTRAKEDRS